MKRFFIIAIVALFLSTGFASAAYAQYDQRCFTKQQCTKARNNDRDGFHQSKETITLCGGQKNAKGEALGFCVPIGKANTSIKIGGKSSFANIGDYIQTIYRYGIGIVGLLATVMIIVAGIQWVSSGGNTATIQSAKKRIGGAILGLLLAVGSYTILGTINPYLVNLRLPQVWLINKQIVAANECKEVPKGSVGKEVGGPFDVNPKTTKCGDSFFVKDSGGQQCVGTACPANHVCLPEGNTQENFSCFRGDIAGYIYNANSLRVALNEATYGIANEEWAYPWVGNNVGQIIEAVGICTNGKTFRPSSRERILPNDNNRKVQKYLLEVNKGSANSKAQSTCGGKNQDEVKGYVLAIEFNESADPTSEEHFIGKAGKSSEGVDLGDDDAFAQIKGKLEPDLLITSGNVRLNINAGNVTDIDNEADRKKAYEKFGYE